MNGHLVMVSRTYSAFLTSHEQTPLLTWTPEAICRKHIFWTIWLFSARIWAKLALNYSKRHLEHDRMPFFPLAPGFTILCLGMCKNQNFHYKLLFFFFNFSPFLFLLFLSFCSSDWPFTGHASSWNKFLRKYHWHGNFYNSSRIAKCSCKKFCPQFFTEIYKYF